MGYNERLIDGAGPASPLTGPKARRRPAQRKVSPVVSQGPFPPALRSTAEGAGRDSMIRFAKPYALHDASWQNVCEGRKTTNLGTS